MNIPEEAIEKAARALYEDTDHWQQRGVPWDKCGQPRRDYFHRKARAALSAAAPYLMAMAWDEGANHAWAESGEGWNGGYPEPETPYADLFEEPRNPYRKEAL